MGKRINKKSPEPSVHQIVSLTLDQQPSRRINDTGSSPRLKAILRSIWPDSQDSYGTRKKTETISDLLAEVQK